MNTKVASFEDGGAVEVRDLTPQELQSANANPIADANRAIRYSIQDLEDTITPRRLREAIRGTDGGWLVDIDNEIAALRAGMTP